MDHKLAVAVLVKTLQAGAVPPDAVHAGGRVARELDPLRIERMELVSAAKLDGFFGQRWKVETVNSVIKRKFGNQIRSRKLSSRYREPIVKGLIYNIHV